MILSNPKAKNLKFKQKTWTFSIITIHWARPRSQKGKKCTDPSQNQCVYLNINTVTLIQISQKNKHKTKLEKKKRAFLSVPILGRWWLQTLWDSKARQLFLGEREFVWNWVQIYRILFVFALSHFSKKKKVISHSFFFFFNFLFIWDTHKTNSIINWN